MLQSCAQLFVCVVCVHAQFGIAALTCALWQTERRNALEQQARKKRSDDDEEEEAGSGEEEAESDEELPPIVERKRLSELEPEEDEEEEKGEEAKRSGPAAVIKTANPNRDRKQGKMMKMKDIGKLADDPDAGPRLTRRERCGKREGRGRTDSP